MILSLLSCLDFRFCFSAFCLSQQQILMYSPALLWKKVILQPWKQVHYIDFENGDFLQTIGNNEKLVGSDSLWVTEFKMNFWTSYKEIVISHFLHYNVKSQSAFLSSEIKIHLNGSGGGGLYCLNNDNYFLPFNLLGYKNS